MSTPLDPAATIATRRPVTDADRERVRARYARPRGRRTAYLALVAALVTILVAWLAWAGGSGASAPVSADVYGFTVTGDHDATARIRVQRTHPERAAVCTLKATAENFVAVGELDATIAPGTEKIAVVDIPLRTVNRATTVEVSNCHTA